MADALVPIGLGDFCFALRGGSRVVRVARHAEAALAMRREACVLSRIADALPVPVPRTRVRRPELACVFSVHTEVSGTELTRDGWRAFQRAKRERIAADVARFLDALHATPIALAAECELEELDQWTCASSLGRSFAEWFDPRIHMEDLARVDAALAYWSRRPTGVTPAPVLVHRDIAPGHLLVDGEGRLSGVIDFGDIALGDPARDFIYIEEDFGPDMLDAVLLHYTHEAASTLRPRIEMWSCLEAIAWLLEPNRDDAEIADLVEDLMKRLDKLAL